MTRAFVFGKFLPFHKGHEALIKFALTKCDFLTVLICCSDKECVDADTRRQWIEESFGVNQHMEIRSYHYSEESLPNTSEPSREVSRIWSAVFMKLFADYTELITSEAYGDYVASCMGIKHIIFDNSRHLFPVSATGIHNDIFANWQFLPDSVKPSYAIKVAILGTESTGKTTLTERLSAHFDCTAVPETARRLIADSNSFQYQDLCDVAREHARLIEKAVIGESPLIIMDTDIYITESYARFIFHRGLEVEDEVYDMNRADLYLYLNNDVSYVQDGTRLSEARRDSLDISHREILKRHNIHLTEITGNWGHRFEEAVAAVNDLIEEKKNEWQH